MKRLAFYFSLVVLVGIITSCSQGKKSHLIPLSSGRPYEVLVVADDLFWSNPDSALFHVLDTDVPGLPQSERSFRISRIRPSFFDRSMSIFRNIILLDIQDIYTQTKFKFVRNAYAAPQMILTIQSPNLEDFSQYVSTHGQVIIDFFTHAEMNRRINLLKKEHNGHVSAKVNSMFGCDIWMPNELISFKEGKDFFWASSGRNDLNFIMYSFPFRDPHTFTKEYFIHKRDSVLKINLPGSREGMYMETADSLFVDVANISVRGDYAFEARGLWEMKNDAMGGPFVSHVRIDRTHARVIVVEGFVFKPEKKKRDLMRKLEAALYTLTLPNDKENVEIPVDSSINEMKIKETKASRSL